MKNKIHKILFFLLLLTLFNSSEKFEKQNLVINSNFDDGFNNWFNFNLESGDGLINIENGELIVKINNEGKVYWSIGVGQGDIKFENNFVYEVSFNARSNDVKQIRALCMMNISPYKTYSGSHTFNLTDKMKKHTFTFTMRHPSDSNACFQFHLGYHGKGTVYIDNIKIIKIGLKEKLIIPKDFPTPIKKEISKGIIFGNTLEAPIEGEWGPELKTYYFDELSKKGIFDHIRIPVRWETHTENKAPFKIDPDFMKRVDWAVSNALHRGFYVVINMHHHNEFENAPMKNKEKFISIWDQISKYFKNYPDNLYFEIYNEPASRISGDKSKTLENPNIWNKLWVEAYNKIRETNPNRKIIITGPIWASVDSLTLLKIPKEILKDPNIIVQFHFYYPAEFCFQGSYGNGFENYKDLRWKGTKREQAEIIKRLDKVTDWAKKNNNLKLWNGEFCAHSTGGSIEEDRLKWDNFVVKQCEARNIAWAYWDFHGDTSRVYDIHENKWYDKIINALTENKLLVDK